jgi:uncharacterized protein (TIGR00645 family)
VPCHPSRALASKAVAPTSQVTVINLSLAGNLLLIAALAGYENFVSKIHIEQHEDRPSWMATVDFSNLKIKVIASIVAISAVALLRAFLSLAEAAQPRRS